MTLTTAGSEQQAVSTAFGYSSGSAKGGGVGKEQVSAVLYGVSGRTNDEAEISVDLLRMLRRRAAVDMIENGKEFAAFLLAASSCGVATESVLHSSDGTEDISTLSHFSSMLRKATCGDVTAVGDVRSVLTKICECMGTGREGAGVGAVVTLSVEASTSTLIIGRFDVCLGALVVGIPLHKDKAGVGGDGSGDSLSDIMSEWDRIMECNKSSLRQTCPKAGDPSSATVGQWTDCKKGLVEKSGSVGQRNRSGYATSREFIGTVEMSAL
jgi:hypothetical protein